MTEEIKQTSKLSNIAKWVNDNFENLSEIFLGLLATCLLLTIIMMVITNIVAGIAYCFDVYRGIF